MQLEQTNITSEETEQLSYHCPKCPQGRMIPSDPEGEPEYTDLFICNNCQHKDHITAFAILFSQVVSSIVGVLVCAYLVSHQLTIITTSSDTNIAIEYGLLTLSGIFFGGFFFILSRAIKGFKHRRLYLKN